MPIIVAGGALVVLLLGAATIPIVTTLTGAHPASTPSAGGQVSSPSGGHSTAGTTRPPSVTYFEAWRDPTEGAFTALLPQGWSATGGVSRPYFGGDFFFEAHDPTGNLTVYFKAPGYPYFAEPSPFNPEGTLVPLAPSFPKATLVVWHYLQAQEFVATKVLTELRKTHPDVRLVSSNARPELARQTIIYVLASRSTGADALFAYTKNGGQYQEGMVVTTDELAGPSGAIWEFNVAGVSAPTADFAAGRNAVAAFAGILPTVTVNSNWLVKELQNQRASTAMIQQTSEFLKQQDYREFLSISETNAAVGQAWANALGGVEVWQNPNTKEVWNVLTAPGEDYVWDCSGYSRIVRTSIEQSPDAAKCVEMRRVRH